tara:strand:- start:737 stop:1333 length:597 start_codon:yes stop_codon:yes gene_type:complete
MKQQVKISKVKGNPSNPRIIKNDKFKKLVKSIQEFPEMLKLRPIIVDENMMVLGGNMRLKASKEAGLKEVWIDIAEGLTEEQKKEFVVKDNVNFGEWDWAILGNEWNTIKITEWGLDVWENQDDRNELNAEAEWTGMPEFNNEDLTPKRQLIISFRNEDDIKVFANLIKQNITDKTKSLWYPEAIQEKQFDKLYTDES